MKTSDIQKLYEAYILPTYTTVPLCLVKGKGVKVWDIEGKEYLDFFPGWAVSGLGHCHPKVVTAIKEQSQKILHISNNFLNVTQARLAERIIKESFPGKVFFCNSGAEAVEGAIKFARKFGHESGRYEIVTMKNAFHGRTLAAITATGQKKYLEGFEPLPEGFKQAEMNDLESVTKLIGPKTIAIMLEPIQGEGGINVASGDFVKELRKICDQKNMLLIFDEVQSGMGRTGKMFAFQHYGIQPDLMTLAKSLGSGVPIGALVVSNKVKNVLTPGTHASTFGGNPLVTRAALAVFDAIKNEKLLKNTQDMGDYLSRHLERLRHKFSFIKEVRGWGLMKGVELAIPGKPIVDECRASGLLINCTQDRVLRIMPPMTVKKKQIDHAMGILEHAMEKIANTI
ncbi:MAG: aspartate aminotransferase family protein [Candidatus Omnitrophica bacterium]|nr:aspartate aminotransferase family protein [Candidatus Omnitrophota bacterium]